jgi:hypothetical protein
MEYWPGLNDRAQSCAIVMLSEAKHLGPAEILRFAQGMTRVAESRTVI